MFNLPCMKSKLRRSKPKYYRHIICQPKIDTTVHRLASLCLQNHNDIHPKLLPGNKEHTWVCLRTERNLATLTIKISQLQNTVKYTKAGKSQILTRPRLGLCNNGDIPRKRRKNTRNLKNQLKGLPRFALSSIYIPCYLHCLLFRLSSK